MGIQNPGVGSLILPRFGLSPQRLRRAGAFTPAQISGLKFWFDASDAATFFSDTGMTTPATSAVAAWADKSGQANHLLQATSARQMIINSTTLNSKNVLTSTGADKSMIFAAGAKAIFNGANTLIVIFRSTNSGDASQYLIAAQLVSTGLRVQLGFTTTDLAFQNRSTSNAQNLTTLARSTTPRLVGWRRSGVNITPYIDGIAGTPGTNSENVSTLQDLVLGGSWNGTTYVNRLSGDFAEIFGFDNSISDVNFNLLGNYVNQKWGTAWTNL